MLHRRGRTGPDPTRPRPHRHAGTASALFNTSRQIGGALAVAVFGGLLADPHTFLAGVRTSLLVAAGTVALATATVPLLRTSATGTTPIRHALSGKDAS